MQAASEKTGAEFAAAQEQLAETTSQMNDAKVSLPQLRKVIEEAENDAAEAARAHDQSRAARDAAKADEAIKRGEADRLRRVATEKQAALAGAPWLLDFVGEEVSTKQAACSNATAAAAAAKEAAELAPADANVAKAAAEAKARADESVAALKETQRTYGESSRMIGALDEVFVRAVASADDARRASDAALKNAIATRTAFDLASENAAAASESLADAREAVQGAEANLKSAAERLESLSATVERLKPGVEKAAAEIAPVKKQVARLTAGQFFTEVYAARQVLRAAQLESDVAAAAAKASQAAAEKAVADVPAFEKRMREFEQAISAAERQVPIAQQTATAAANMAKAMEQLAGERDAFVKQSFEQAAKIAEMSTRDPENKVLVEAADASKTVGELLAADLEKFRERVKDRHKLAKEAEDALASTRAALDREKLEQKNAPQTLESLRSAIPTAQALAAEKKAAAEVAAQKLMDAKARSDQLDTQYADLKKQLGLSIQS
jgi:chromosome segregation ATPase